MNVKSIYCNNCGIKGHMYKDCKFPIISCGNLIYRTDCEKPKILMIQRKDSLCYIEFIRGKYDTYNIKYIQILIDKCTKEEFSELKKLNDIYKKFGFPFILAVKGKSKIEILNNFRKRINSEPQIEFEEAVKQVKKIASLRLKDINIKNI